MPACRVVHTRRQNVASNAHKCPECQWPACCDACLQQRAAAVRWGVQCCLHAAVSCTTAISNQPAA